MSPESPAPMEPGIQMTGALRPKLILNRAFSIVKMSLFFPDHEGFFFLLNFHFKCYEPTLVKDALLRSNDLTKSTILLES